MKYIGLPTKTNSITYGMRKAPIKWTIKKRQTCDYYNDGIEIHAQQ